VVTLQISFDDFFQHPFLKDTATTTGSHSDFVALETALQIQEGINKELEIKYKEVLTSHANEVKELEKTCEDLQKKSQQQESKLIDLSIELRKKQTAFSDQHIQLRNLYEKEAKKNAELSASLEEKTQRIAQLEKELKESEAVLVEAFANVK
jgi:hypothetical protein